MSSTPKKVKNDDLETIRCEIRRMWRNGDMFCEDWNVG